MVLLVAGAVLQGLGRRGVEEVVRAEGSEVRVLKRVDAPSLTMVVSSVLSRRADLSAGDGGRIVRASKEPFGEGGALEAASRFVLAHDGTNLGTCGCKSNEQI